MSILNRVNLQSRFPNIRRRMLRRLMLMTNRIRHLTIRNSNLNHNIRHRQATFRSQTKPTDHATSRHISTHRRLLSIRKLCRMIINASLRTFSLILPTQTHNRSRSQRLLTLLTRLPSRISTNRLQRTRISSPSIRKRLTPRRRTVLTINHNISHVTLTLRTHNRNLPGHNFIFSRRSSRQ